MIEKSEIVPSKPIEMKSDQTNRNYKTNIEIANEN